MEAAAGGGLLDFEEEVFVVPVAPAPTQHRTDVAVDRFDFPEGDLLVAVVQDAVQMARQHPAELLEGRQPLPAESEEPVGEEAARRPLVGVGPELGQLLLEEVGLRQAAIEGKEVAEGLTLLPVQVHPAAQQEPALAPDEPAGLGPLPEELRPTRLIHRLTGMAQDGGPLIR